MTKKLSLKQQSTKHQVPGKNKGASIPLKRQTIIDIATDLAYSNDNREIAKDVRYCVKKLTNAIQLYERTGRVDLLHSIKQSKKHISELMESYLKKTKE